MLLTQQIPTQQILTQQICCPNCGSRQAERHHLQEQALTRTQCPECDYLLISCSITAKVVEAYIPGVNKLAAKLPAMGLPEQVRTPKSSTKKIPA